MPHDFENYVPDVLNMGKKYFHEHCFEIVDAKFVNFKTFQFLAICACGR
jgi:hypothetical protein